MKLITIGADPEVILTRGGSPVPAKPLFNHQDNAEAAGAASVYRDGALVEFGLDPQATSDGFSSAVYDAIGFICERAAGEGMEASDRVVGVFSEDILDDDELSDAGCMPDINIYTGTQNHSPRGKYAASPVRCAGGHVHLGIGDFDCSYTRQITLALDLLLEYGRTGVGEERRRQLYGSAGSIRMPDHGIEYRTPSNWWVFKEGGPAEVYDVCCMALEVAQDDSIMRGGVMSLDVGVDLSKIRDCIDCGRTRSEVDDLVAYIRSKHGGNQ